jgi:hypothetical protein
MPFDASERAQHPSNIHGHQRRLSADDDERTT